MNAASAIVLAVVLAAAGFAVWRNLRKGAPCSCGESGDCCCCKGKPCKGEWSDSKPTTAPGTKVPGANKEK